MPPSSKLRCPLCRKIVGLFAEKRPILYRAACGTPEFRAPTHFRHGTFLLHANARGLEPCPGTAQTPARAKILAAASAGPE